MHLRPTQELTDRTPLVKVRYLGVHLRSNTTMKACFTRRVCHSMDHMGTEATVADNPLFETCQLGGIRGLRTPQSFLSKGTQALHKISERYRLRFKWSSGLFPGFFGTVGPMVPKQLSRVKSLQCLSNNCQHRARPVTVDT